MKNTTISFFYGDLFLAALWPAPILAGGSPYYMRLATLALVYMAWTVAFNLIFGHTEQLFLCVGALAGSAAYMTVVLTKQLALSPWLSVPLGVATAAGPAPSSATSPCCAASA